MALGSSKKFLSIVGPRVSSAIIMGFLLIILSTTLFSWWSIGEIKLQPIMAVVVWCGSKLPLLPGGIVVMLLGCLGDSLSGGIVGLQVIVNVVVFCLCTISLRQLTLNNWLYQMLAVGVMSIISPLIILGGLMLTSQQYIVPSNILPLLLWQAALSTLLSPLFFLILEGVTRITQKVWAVPKHGKTDII